MEAYTIDLDSLTKKEKFSVWDKDVPIIKDSKGTYHCYLSSDVDSPDTYNELCYVIENCKGTVILHLNTYGGHIDSAFKIISSINRSKAKVKARLTGTVASAGTIIALKCKELEVEDYTHFMIHNYSSGAQGKGHELMDYVNFNDKQLKITFTEIYKNFLTSKEIKDVLAGKDMWLSADNVRERWLKKVTSKSE